ncbi:MAG: hypothetical protein ABIK83_07885 [Candidatus Zixiibacteriota bacterium]
MKLVRRLAASRALLTAGLLLVTVGCLYAQEIPKPAGLTVISYADVTVSTWQINNELVAEKIVVLDSLYQMPDVFFAAEQAINDRFTAWQDSVMTAHNTTTDDYLDFGLEHRLEIDKYFQNSGQKEVLDSLQAEHNSLYTIYQERRVGYNIDDIQLAPQDDE